MHKVFESVVGNGAAVAVLSIEIEASIRMGVPMRTVLMTGPAGVGKTMFSKCIAKAFDAQFIHVNCGSLKAADNYESVLVSQLSTRPVFGGHVQSEAVSTVVLWDESHRIPSNLQNEMLMPLLEKFHTCHDRSTMGLKGVINIFATTNPEKMLQPLKDRCEVQISLQKYTTPELAKIVGKFDILDQWCEDGRMVQQWFEIEFDPLVCMAIADVARSVPRIAENIAIGFYRYVRAQSADVDQAMASATKEKLDGYLQLNGIFFKGMKRQDFMYLKMLHDSGTKPVGLPQIVAQMGLDKIVIEREIEPFLRELGYIQQTKQGRMLTIRGRQFIQYHIQRHEANVAAQRTARQGTRV